MLKRLILKLKNEKLLFLFLFCFCISNYIYSSFFLNYLATYFYYNNTDLNPSISKKKGRKIGLILSHVALFFSKSYEGYFELCLKHSFSSSRKTQWKSRDEWVNPFLGTCLLLYTLKTCFKWVQKETSGREWMRPFQVIILSVKRSCSRGIQREFNLKSVKKISYVVASFLAAK